MNDNRDQNNVHDSKDAQLEPPEGGLPEHLFPAMPHMTPEEAEENLLRVIKARETIRKEKEGNGAPESRAEEI
jgi:hypothetical protein